jgi:hypothetical protein
MLCLPYYCLCLLFNKIREEGGTGSAWKWEVGRVGGGRGAQTMYAHVSECKNDKIKEEIKVEWRHAFPVTLSV